MQPNGRQNCSRSPYPLAWVIDSLLVWGTLASVRWPVAKREAGNNPVGAPSSAPLYRGKDEASTDLKPPILPEGEGEIGQSGDYGTGLPDRSSVPYGSCEGHSQRQPPHSSLLSIAQNVRLETDVLPAVAATLTAHWLAASQLPCMPLTCRSKVTPPIIPK